MKKRSPAAVALLTIITLGIYGVVWFQTFADESRKTGSVGLTNTSYRLNIVFYILTLASAAGLGWFAASQNVAMTVALAVSLAVIRIADAVIVGSILNSALSRIYKFFEINESPAHAYTATAVILPFVTFATAQSAFNHAEDKAQALEADKG